MNNEHPLWADAGSRALEVMGNIGLKYNREVEDKVNLLFTHEEWCRIFNVDPEFKPCGVDWIMYKEDRPIHIHFVRRIKEEKT